MQDTITITSDGTFWYWTLHQDGTRYRCTLRYSGPQWARWDARHHADRGWLDSSSYIEADR